MGKPYQSELAKLSETYQWALSLDAKPLEEHLVSVANCPLVAIGSGGSYSTATLMADLHQRQTGEVGMSDTPLMAASYLKQLKGSAVALVSGAGLNPRHTGSGTQGRAVGTRVTDRTLCFEKHHLWRGSSGNYARGFCFEFNVPAGKDGFLGDEQSARSGSVAPKGYGISDLLPQSIDPSLIAAGYVPEGKETVRR